MRSKHRPGNAVHQKNTLDEWNHDRPHVVHWTSANVQCSCLTTDDKFMEHGCLRLEIFIRSRPRSLLIGTERQSNPAYLKQYSRCWRCEIQKRLFAPVVSAFRIATFEERCHRLVGGTRLQLAEVGSWMRTLRTRLCNHIRIKTDRQACSIKIHPTMHYTARPQHLTAVRLPIVLHLNMNYKESRSASIARTSIGINLNARALPYGVYAVWTRLHSFQPLKMYL